MEEELKSGDNLKPDTSDRRPAHGGRKVRQNNLKINLSRQHFMIGGGIIILLLLIFAIASALNSSDKAASESQANGSAKEVNLSGSNDSQLNNSSNSRAGNSAGNADMGMVQGQPQNNSLGQAPQNGMQQDVANNNNGNVMPDEQAQQQGGEGMSLLGGLPVGPATLIGAAGRATNAAQPQNMANTSGGNTSLRPIRDRHEPVKRVEARRPTVAAKEAYKAAPAKVNTSAKASQVVATPSKTVPPKSAVPAHTQTPVTNTTSRGVATAPTAASSTATPSTSTAPAAVPNTASSSTVSGRYTLQLSGASQPNTLDAFAKQQKLSNYQVYKTNRNGQPWYVLISGSYATPAEAKNAIAAMPAEVKAKNPWVRQVSQVQSAK